MPMLYQPGQHIDHYTIIRQLSVGKNSRVYLARDTQTEQQVVLKFPIEDLMGGADSYKSYMMISFGFLAQFAHSAAH